MAATAHNAGVIGGLLAACSFAGTARSNPSSALLALVLFNHSDPVRLAGLFLVVVVLQVGYAVESVRCPADQ